MIYNYCIYIYIYIYKYNLLDFPFFFVSANEGVRGLNTTGVIVYTSQHEQSISVTTYITE